MSRDPEQPITACLIHMKSFLLKRNKRYLINRWLFRKTRVHSTKLFAVVKVLEEYGISSCVNTVRMQGQMQDFPRGVSTQRRRRKTLGGSRGRSPRKIGNLEGLKQHFLQFLMYFAYNWGVQNWLNFSSHDKVKTSISHNWSDIRWRNLEA